MRLSRLLRAFLLASVLAFASAGRDFYKVLGIDRGADDRTLKKAYRSLALQHHPDKGGSEEKFAEISQAYDVLSDKDKRRVYDQYGEDGVKQHEQGGAPGGGGGFPGGFPGGGFPGGFGGGGQQFTFQFGGPSGSRGAAAAACAISTSSRRCSATTLASAGRRATAVADVPARAARQQQRAVQGEPLPQELGGEIAEARQVPRRRRQHVWLIEFPPWCGHCQQLKPTWERLAVDLKGFVKVGAVNCEKEKQICATEGWIPTPPSR